MDLKNKSNLKKIELVANNIKTLALDSITYANSGHPGIVLSSANILAVLFQNHLNLDPNNLDMFNRDRFIMEAGHGSALLYSTMLVFGYNSLSISDLKKFRQINSKTPGHPENLVTTGIEYTTGPLGQGIGSSIGFAIGETHLSAIYNKDVDNLIDHYTYCFMSDGGFEEGISYESLSLAGKYKLNKLIFLYDSNDIQLDGKVNSNTITDTKKYFESLGLNYILVKDGFDFIEIDNALTEAKKSKDKPTIIEFKTILGKDSINENTHKVHGNPLSIDELVAYKEKINWKHDAFTLLEETVEIISEFKERGKKASLDFNNKYNELKKINFSKYEMLKNSIEKNYDFSSNIFDDLINDVLKTKEYATRDLSGLLLQKLLNNNELFLITNPDISSSTKIINKSFKDYNSSNLLNTNIQVGVREFAALTIINGIVAHGGLKGISSAFLCFSDYSKAALRIAAISNLPIILFYSHDSVYVGEDGPTHEPIEQISSLRLIPNHNLYRPSNVYELIEALKFAVSNKTTPTSIITSRSKFINYISSNLNDIKYGGYVFSDEEKYQIIIIATGSEVATAMQVKEILKKSYSINTKIVSMNSTFIFDKQSEDYKKKVLSLDKKFIFSIEFGITAFWYKYADHPIGIDSFGFSGKSNDLIKQLELDPDSIAKKINVIYSNIIK